jgi:hypothetical protein
VPWVSDAQRRWGHTARGQRALGGKGKVHEWDTASRGHNLPERTGPKQGKWSRRRRHR